MGLIMGDDYLPILLDMQKTISETKTSVDALVDSSKTQHKRITKLENGAIRLAGIATGASLAAGASVNWIIDIFKH